MESNAISVTDVFHWNYESDARIKINQGGTYSGKTYAILQVIFMRLLEKKRIATVVGQDIPNLKKGALRDFKERILPTHPWMQEAIIAYNASERKYTFRNGSVLEFTSFKDPQDARSGKRDISFFNEANGIAWGIFQQAGLIRSEEEIFIDYNPSEEFWAHDELMNRNDSVIFYSNFTDNPHVPVEVIEYLYGLKERDPMGWQVYGLGKTGQVEELIYKNIEIVPSFPAGCAKVAYGMDFGYTADPTALVKCGVMNKRDLYCEEVFYDFGMTTDDIDNALESAGVLRGQVIWADSAEARLIDELQKRGWKIRPVKKGPGSVAYGINLLQDYDLKFTEGSQNLITESRRYKNKRDRKTGKILKEPVDAWNHGMDALRYYALETLKKRKRAGVRYRN